jgi:hypothetical protein
MKVSRYERNEVDEYLSDTTHVALETTVKYSGKTPSSILRDDITHGLFSKWDLGRHVFSLFKTLRGRHIVLRPATMRT